MAGDGTRRIWFKPPQALENIVYPPLHSRLVAHPTFPLRETGYAFVALGILLPIVGVLTIGYCSYLPFGCVEILPVAFVLSPFLIVGGILLTRYHRPPDPTQVSGQPEAQACPVCGAMNPRLSSGFCFRCGAALPPPY